MRPATRTIVYGPQGHGKSWFAATYGGAYLAGHTAGPSLILMSDPRGKDAAYLGFRGEGKLNAYGLDPRAMKYEEGENDLGTDAKGHKLILPYTNVSVEGKVVARIEYFHEDELVFSEQNEKVAGWTALTKFRKRLNTLFRDERNMWGTLIDDSQTSKELAFRNYMKYVQLPDAHGEAQKKWWGNTTDEMEMQLAMRYAGWKRNLVVICHTDKDVYMEEPGSTNRVRGPRLPGRLSGDLASYYPECYHAESVQDAKGIIYMLRTRPSDYVAFSNILHAPNPSKNTYDGVWENF